MNDEIHSFKIRALKMRKMSEESNDPDVKLRFRKIAERWLDFYQKCQSDAQKS